MKKTLSILAILFFLVNMGFSQEHYMLIDGIKVYGPPDHLLPTQSYFDINSDWEIDYYNSLKSKLMKNLPDYILTKLLLKPTFSPEGLLYTFYDKETRSYNLVYCVAKENIWYAKNRTLVKTKTYQSIIDSSDYVNIESLYAVFLLNTKHSEKGLPGIDGTTYIFSKSSYGFMSGQCWSPSESSKLGKLVSINIELIELLMKKPKKIAIKKELNERIENLKNEITVANNKYSACRSS